MAKERITVKQRDALKACAEAGRLVRGRAGWSLPGGGFAASFQTVHSLIERGLLSTEHQPKGQCALTMKGRDAL